MEHRFARSGPDTHVLDNSPPENKLHRLFILKAECWNGDGLFTRLTLVRIAWIPLFLLANLVMASAVINRDAIPLGTLLGIGLFTFYTDFGGALLFFARDADYYLVGLAPPERAD